MGFHIAFTKLMKIHESIKMINVPFSEKGLKTILFQKMVRLVYIILGLIIGI